MLIAILVLMVFHLLFTMALVGHISSIEKIVKSMAEAKIEEMKLWRGADGTNK